MQKNSIFITFLDGAKVEIKGDNPDHVYTVMFTDVDTGELVYRTQIKATPEGYWCAPSPKYYIRWRVEVFEGEEKKFDYTLDLKDKDVLIVFESNCLGDNIAWVPMVEEFRKVHGCRVDVVTFYNEHFIGAYPNLNFLTHAAAYARPHHAIYRLGAYADNHFFRNRNKWRFVPLQQIASDGLGLPRQEIAPRIKRERELPDIREPYVVITEFSTWLGKQWMFPGGWQGLVEHINAAGFKVVSISKEPSNLNNVIKRNGRGLHSTIRTMQYAKAFIGVSTGPSVLAWALGLPVVIISGCTMPWSEFKSCIRIVNENVCHGCMNDTEYQILDRGNWKTCLANRNFVCSREITLDYVWSKVEPMLALIPKDPPATKKILYVTPHCSTGGGPQYLLRCVEEARTLGYDVSVVEYQNISDTYVVQKNRIKELVPFFTLNGNKLLNFQEIVAKFGPDVVHLHEFPERFMEDSVAEWFYRKDRSYRIVETPHSQHGRREKRFWPDGFVFVSDHHVPQFADTKIPYSLVEYRLDKRSRPPREEVLTALGLDPAKRHVLNVGLLWKGKNQSELIEMAERLPDIEFHLVGNAADNFRDYWQPLLERKPENVTHWGERADVDSFYAAMDLFVFCSKDGSELNPIVLKEALSWDLPVLMRRQSTCSNLDHDPLVTYYSTVEQAVYEIRNRFPSRSSMGSELSSFYEAIR